MADYRTWLKRCVYRANTEKECLYQGLGPGNTALFFYGAPGVDESLLTDCFVRNGGVYGKCMAWMFQEKGQILISKQRSGLDENTLVLEGLGAGAENVLFDEGDLVELWTKPSNVFEIADILQFEGIPLLQKGKVLFPKTQTLVEGETEIRNLCALLEEVTALETIHNVTADFWILDEILERMV